MTLVDRARWAVATVMATALAVATLVAALVPTAAWGHASGVLPHAELDVDGTDLTVTWTAAPDDAADVGVAIGLFPEGTMEAFLEGEPEELPSPEEIRALSRSDELRGYLLDNIQVRQDGHACTGVAQPADDFILDGAQVTFTCPEPVEQVDLRITMLHDRDPAYRTFSVDGTVQYAVHTSTAPEHTWDFTLAGDGQRPFPVALVVGLVLVVGGAAASLLSVRARRRTPARVRR